MVDTIACCSTKLRHKRMMLIKEKRLQIKATRERKSSQRMVYKLIKALIRSKITILQCLSILCKYE